jgi:hypothetical protein
MVDSRPGETVANPAGKPHNVPTGQPGCARIQMQARKKKKTIA